MTPELLWLFIVLLAIFFGTMILSMWILTAVFGLEFQMTPEQENETKILPYCYIQNSVLITELNSTCFYMYGGPVN